MINTLEDEIISIEELDEEYTIDISVDGNNLFFANDILTHNSQTNRSVSRDNMSAEDLTEAVIAESFKKLSIADFMLALVATPEDRVKGNINMKVLKDREGAKDIIIPMKVNYPQLRLYDVGKN